MEVRLATFLHVLDLEGRNYGLVNLLVARSFGAGCVIHEDAIADACLAVAWRTVLFGGWCHIECGGVGEVREVVLCCFDLSDIG